MPGRQHIPDRRRTGTRGKHRDSGGRNTPLAEHQRGAAMEYLRRRMLVVAAGAALLALPVMSTLRGQTPVEPPPAVNSDPGDLLGPAFESESAGISLRLPKGCI